VNRPSEVARDLSREFGKLTLTLASQLNKGNPQGNMQQQPRGNFQQPLKPLVCYKCGEPGHKSSECRKPNTQQRPAVTNYAHQGHYPRQQYEPRHAEQRMHDQQQYAARHGQPQQQYDQRAHAHLMSRSEPVVGQHAAHADHIPATAEAQIYATGAAERGPRAPVPFPPDAVNSRRMADAGRGAATNPGRAPTYNAPAFGGGGMPPIPGPVIRNRHDFDVVSQLEGTKVNYKSLIRECPRVRQDILELISEVEAAAPRITSRPAPARPRPAPARPVPVPFTFPTRPAAAPAQAGPSAQQGPIPMGSGFDAELAYRAGRPYHDRTAQQYRSATVNSVVKADVCICGQVFEGIIDTDASDSAVSHAVIRRLGLMNETTPSNLTFLTAGGSSESPMGVMKELPIRIGSLELKIDTMVTPANNSSVRFGPVRFSSVDVFTSVDVLLMTSAALCVSKHSCAGMLLWSAQATCMQ